MDRAVFGRKVEVALRNLRDTARLGATGLSKVFVPEAPPGQGGWQLNAFLLRRISELSPVGDAQDSWTWRRFNLLTLRFVNEMPIDQIALTLRLSQRHVYRQLERALEEFVEALWQEFHPRIAETEPQNEDASSEPADADDLLSQELANILQVGGSASLSQVVLDVECLLRPALGRRAIALTCEIAPDLAPISLSPEILRQFLLKLIGHLIQRPGVTGLSLHTQGAEGSVDLVLQIHRTTREGPDMRPSDEELSLGKALAPFDRLRNVRTEVLKEGRHVVGVRVCLPTDQRLAVLIVDDNADVALLLRRYLLLGGYEPVIATTAAEAIALARSRQFYAITLDLMMNDRDGWDVLQTLANDVRTEQIPVIVCSVLDQKDLAFLLGASAFLRKPVRSEDLLQALAEIKLCRPAPAAARGEDH